MNDRFVRFVNSLGVEEDRRGGAVAAKSIVELVDDGWRIAGSFPLWGGSLVYLERGADPLPG